MLTSTGSYRRSADITASGTGPRALPPLRPAEPLSFPQAEEIRLDSGLHIVAVPSRGIPLVEVRVLMPCVTADPLATALAEMLAATAFTGTVPIADRDISWETALVTGRPRAQRTREWLILEAHGYADELSHVLGLLAAWLRSPDYAEDRIGAERERISQAVPLLAVQPRRIALRELNRARYGALGHFDELPPPDIIAGLTADDIRETHRRYLSPQGAHVIVVGDIEAPTAVAAAMRAFAHWQGDAHAPSAPETKYRPDHRMRLIARPGAAQSHLALSCPSIPFADPRYPPLAVANAVFAGYFSSRLVMNIRERKGMTYHATSRFDRTLGDPSVVVEGVCGTGATEQVLSETLAEMARMAVEPPTEQEIAAARAYLAGSLLTATASQSDLASLLASLCCWDVDLNWIERYPQQLLDVTAADVADVCAEFFGAGPSAGVIVGDTGVIGQTMAPFGFMEAHEAQHQEGISE